MAIRKTCPRDGQPNCSLVDSLEDQYSGKVTHFVSWCWGYTLQDFASAIHSWLQRSKLSAEDVFLWVCFFCNNQYRIMDSGSTKTGSDELKSVFETHLAEAGLALVLVSFGFLTVGGSMSYFSYDYCGLRLLTLFTERLGQCRARLDSFALAADAHERGGDRSEW
eukprot:s259_g19.t1